MLSATSVSNPFYIINFKPVLRKGLACRSFNAGRGGFFVFVLILLLSCPILNCSAQDKPTVKQLAAFPEDYLSQVITFPRIRWYPTLSDNKDGTYDVLLDQDESVDGGDFAMGSLKKIQSVVSKDICKQLINDDLGGFKMYYWGAVTGKVIKVEKFIADYYFQITKITSVSWEDKILATYE